MKDGDNVLLTNEEKAQKLAQQFESAHNFNVSPIENEVSLEYQNIVNQEFSSEDVFNTNLNEIKSIINQLP